MGMNPETTNEPKGSMSRSGLAARLRILEGKYKSQADALRAYGITKTSYRNWISEKSSPSLESIAKIAKEADVSLDWLAFGEDSQSADQTGHKGSHEGLDVKLMFEVWSSIQGIVDSYHMKYSAFQHITLTCQIYESMKSDPDKAEETRVKMLALVEASIKGLFDDSDTTETVDDQLQA